MGYALTYLLSLFPDKCKYINYLLTSLAVSSFSAGSRSCCSVLISVFSSTSTGAPCCSGGRLGLSLHKRHTGIGRQQNTLQAFFGTQN